MKLEIKGNPIPWKRARRKGNDYYDPQLKEKESFAWEAKANINYSCFLPFTTPLYVFFDFRMPIPRSLSKKKKKELEGMHSRVKPDLSNLIKFAEDALSGLIWCDDNIISEVRARKVYDENPRTIIKIEQIS